MFYPTSRAILLAGLLLSLVACSGSSGSISSNNPVAESPVEQPSATPPPATQPPATEPPATQPPAEVPLPRVTLEPTPTTVTPGSSATLNWTSTNVDDCQASGGWSGSRPVSGSEPTATLNQTSSFSLVCSGPGGSITRTVTVDVASQLPQPEIDLRTSASTVNSGDRVELTWSTSAAESCTASGGWSGDLPVAGSQLSAPLGSNSTFNLTCSNAAGSAIAMVNVDVIGQLSLRWQAPTENVDGTPLTDLASYRIYYGTNSRNYSDTADIDDADTTSIDLQVISGSYYVALTAIDADGNESGYSNEILKSTN